MNVVLPRRRREVATSEIAAIVRVFPVPGGPVYAEVRIGYTIIAYLALP